MPEGDTVWRVARQLNFALAGRVLTRSDFRVPRFATTDLTGRTVLDVVPRGKHILTRVEADGVAPRHDDPSGSGLTIHTHLRMDGSWRIRAAGSPSTRDHRVRLVLANDEWEAVGYQLGVVEVLPTARESLAIGHLGPDLLGPDWDAAEAVRRLQSDPERPAGEALMDQRNLAGIGNLYKAEVLFLKGINPWRKVGDIADIGAVVELAKRLLEANKERPAQVTTGDRARGRETWVYGRVGRPCRRCGTPVRAEGYAGRGTASQERVTFWCPSCQPA